MPQNNPANTPRPDDKNRSTGGQSQPQKGGANPREGSGSQQKDDTSQQGGSQQPNKSGSTPRYDDRPAQGGGQRGGTSGQPKYGDTEENDPRRSDMEDKGDQRGGSQGGGQTGGPSKGKTGGQGNS